MPVDLEQVTVEDMHFAGGRSVTEGAVFDRDVGHLAEILNRNKSDFEKLQIPVSEVGVKQTFEVNGAGGASENIDVAIPAGMVIRVFDARTINLAMGTATDTAQVQKFPSGGPAANITDAMDISGADQTIARAGTIDDANFDLDGDAGDSLRVAITDGGGTDSPATKTFVDFVRVS